MKKKNLPVWRKTVKNPTRRISISFWSSLTIDSKKNLYDRMIYRKLLKALSGNLKRSFKDLESRLLPFSFLSLSLSPSVFSPRSTVPAQNLFNPSMWPINIFFRLRANLYAFWLLFHHLFIVVFFFTSCSCTFCIHQITSSVHFLN